MLGRVLLVAVGVAVGYLIRQNQEGGKSESSTRSTEDTQYVPVTSIPPEPAEAVVEVEVEGDEEDEITIEVEPSNGRVDDLTTVKGIGPAYARRLQAAGIRTYAELAAADPEIVRIATKVREWQRPNVAEWQAEAAELAG